jgi:hypothetical protein
VSRVSGVLRTVSKRALALEFTMVRMNRLSTREREGASL